MDFFLSKKVIVGLFFLIFLEVTFLFFYHQSKVRDTIPNQNWTKENIPGNFVSILSFHYLFSLNKGSLRGMTLRNTYDGRIARIHNAPGVHIGFLYEKAIELVENKGTNIIPITRGAYDNIIITDWNQNSIKFEDLKVGDNIEITETLDLKQRYPLADQKIVIVKINR